MFLGNLLLILGLFLWSYSFIFWNCCCVIVY